MYHTVDKIDTHITLLPLLLKIFAMFQMRLWYYKENLEENVVETIAVSCSNCGETTGLYVKNTNTNYNNMITKFLFNIVLHHVGMPWIIEKKCNMILTNIIQIG